MSFIPETLKEYRFLHYFEEITKIPHGSRNSAKIADYLESFAKERSLDYHRDKDNNVIIKKNASKGYSARDAVILQGHTDMVIARVGNAIKSSEEDFTVNAYIDGDFIKAEESTLGADNGIAVAYMLAILDDSELRHPSIEAVFTSDEEIGMVGASSIDLSKLKGRMLINLDSEEEGYFTVGCAGGISSTACFKVLREKSKTKCYKLTVSGLRGGHSGIEIDKGGANAIRVVGEILSKIRQVKIANINGGSAENAIPKECECIFACTNDTSLANITDAISKKYSQNDSEIKITVTPYDYHYCLTQESSLTVISFINEAPNGVIKMSEDIKGLVETSLNLGVIKTDYDEIILSYALRSSSINGKNELRKNLAVCCKKYSATLIEEGDYPAWEFKKESYLRDRMQKVYKDLYKKDPIIMTIHAGLECGILSSKVENLDCISIGPDMFDVHTIDEKLSISSAIRVWDFIKEVLKNL